MDWVTLIWLPNFRAYSVRYRGRVLGLVRCGAPMPFRFVVTLE